MNCASPEFRLLLTSCRSATNPRDQLAIRELLRGKIDWTELAANMVSHGVANLVAHTLISVASDLVPSEMLDAFRAVLDQAGKKNKALFDDLVRIDAELACNNIHIVPIKGPTLAISAYHDLRLREFRDLDFLIRDSDLEATISILARLGYHRRGDLNKKRSALVHRLQGQDILFKEDGAGAVEPHTRLTSLKTALDIDYAGLWQRVHQSSFNDRVFLTLAQEDNLLMLAVHGSKEMWWNLKWACDVAEFIHAHPDLDWNVIVERAHSQGCQQMLLLACFLAIKFFEASAPPWVVDLIASNPAIANMGHGIWDRWLANEMLGPPSNNKLSIDRLRLHDDVGRRTRYLLKTLLLPGPHHVASIPVPEYLTWAYPPIALAHDLFALPLYRAYRTLLRYGETFLGGTALPVWVLDAFPLPAETKGRIRQLREAQLKARSKLDENPDNAAAWAALGDAHLGLRQYNKAVECYDKALVLVPENVTLWKKREAACQGDAITRGDATHAESRVNPQLEVTFSKQLAIEAVRLFSMQRYDEAIDASERALEHAPDDATAARIGIQSRLFACDWRRRDRDRVIVREGIRQNRNIIAPFFHRAISSSEEEHLELVRQSSLRLVGHTKKTPMPPRGTSWSDSKSPEKIRIAYCSTDFRDHVVSEVFVGCLEHHDRSRFEITAISLGPDDGSDMRLRVMRAVDHFIDAAALADDVVVQRLKQLGVDIVVDLNGRSGDTRKKIFQARPAAIQVTFLGYPGTTGLHFYDYVLADRVVIPLDARRYYTEQVVYLPDTYLPTDRSRVISEKRPGRVEAGLPGEGFVFVCHNHEYKIAPEIFAVWMRLLDQVAGSVLWLKSLNPTATISLRREATACGVDPSRLIFAPRLKYSSHHLARLGLADLALDTLPYNAHATACDALWVGVPMVTCTGSAFPGRVGTSVLNAIGLSELITSSLSEYEAVALSLAKNPELLTSIKTKLVQNRDKTPLFDTPRYTRNLERAYEVMWKKQTAGQPAAAFQIE